MLESVYVDTKTELLITDYIAGMSDDFALEAMRQISIPEPLDFSPRQ